METRISIIGSAGRKDDRSKVTKRLYEFAYQHALTQIKLHKGQKKLTLVSGGAAFVDHLAVQLFLNKQADHLVLHLPAPFQNSAYVGKDWQNPGRIANHYHALFSRKVNISSLRDIQRAIESGAETYYYDGFLARNLEVGKTDLLIAMTFGTHSGFYSRDSLPWQQPQAAGLKPGGTSHTWQASKAPLKIHKNLNDFC